MSTQPDVLIVGAGFAGMYAIHRFRKQGLEVVTVYGTDRIPPEDMPALLADRKMVHPVLLDPTSAYREAQDLAVYPVGTLLDRDGRVIWQGRTQRKTFAAACEKQLEALFVESPRKEAGAGSGKR